MRNLLLTAAALAGLGSCWAAAASLTTDRQPEPKWYVAHLDAEPCVPVTDIGDRFERVYYGTGPFRTPDQIRAAWQREVRQYPGARVGDWKPDLKPGVRAFEVSYRDLDVWMMFFADEAECQGAMASVRR